MRPLLFLLVFSSLGCIEDRLVVDLTTEIHADGTCHRRAVYRLTRIDSEHPEAPLPIPERRNALVRLHRFPSDRPWVVHREKDGQTEVVTVEAELSSPNAIGSDYYRRRLPKARPAQNTVSFAKEPGETGDLYEYAETLRDPASPVAAARALAKALNRRGTAFAREFVSRAKTSHPKRSDVKRIYSQTFALPLFRGVSTMSTRAPYGLKERHDLEGLFLRSHFEPDLEAGLSKLMSGTDPADVRLLVDESLDALLPSLETEMADSGLPMDALFPEFQASRAPIHFRAHLVMPVPIVRANACASGNAVSWEFEGDDLYGKGFDMFARASNRPTL